MKPWKILRSRKAFEHRWYTVRQDCVELPDGRILDDYFVSVRPDVVLVLAVTEEHRVPLVRQYKHGVQKLLLELPGGFIEAGEGPVEAARRELAEETGYTAAEFHLLGKIHDNPTKDTNTDFLFLAAPAAATGRQCLDQYENIAVELRPLHELAELIISGEICVGNSISTIFLALECLKRRQIA
ncbi:NUDIX hydrolase [candidate division KSB3 bacterium]|uniref:NUDIX hydrolase n=1 Tax=candidate division KSB3 bacterium TaxID=2044937 RepID=A0A2G6E934_9BACT|nr:MAG: NUDIX hydrolase [candidate division KSB3 bacterium]PIE29554.1 MAG: NUDIX hydrolase [candidate division KSB3 bacterium]